MTPEPLFLSEESIHDFHDSQIQEHGGLDGVGDPNGLASAIASPQNTYCYDPKATIFDIAADYAYHISMSQAFLDGNKRTGLQAAIAFLRLNGYSVGDHQKNLFTEGMLKMHSGAESKAQFSELLRKCSVREGVFFQWLKNLFR